MSMVDFLNLYIIVFFVGVAGIFITRKNLLVILMSIEVMLLSINILFIVYSVYLDDVVGHIFALFILVIAAAESAIGLAILVCYYRLKTTIGTFYINSLKG